MFPITNAVKVPLALFGIYFDNGTGVLIPGISLIFLFSSTLL